MCIDSVDNITDYTDLNYNVMFHFRYKTLMPAIEITTTRSTMVVKSYDFKEDIERKTDWLKIAEDKLAVSFVHNNNKIMVEFYIAFSHVQYILKTPVLTHYLNEYDKFRVLLHQQDCVHICS